LEANHGAYQGFCRNTSSAHTRNPAIREDHMPSVSLEQLKSEKDGRDRLTPKDWL
jgi:hypothetical protein